MREMLDEVNRFRAWAGAYPADRSGEWECDYDRWEPLHSAVLEFTQQHPSSSWSDDEWQAVLYAIARDNELQHLSREIGKRFPDLLLDLTDVALREGEPEAKWQLAHELGSMAGDPTRRDRLLQSLTSDADEYVRRRALHALARTSSPATEQIALEAWSRSHQDQEWTRMMVLWAMHRIRSDHLERLLAEAECDGGPHLCEYAAKIRNGQVDHESY